MDQTSNITEKDQILVEAWLAIRREAGVTIDPQTADEMWKYANTIDPYGACADLTDEEMQIGRVYFTRAPGSDIWVHHGDLPDAILRALQGSEQEHRTLAAYDDMLPWLVQE